MTDITKEPELIPALPDRVLADEAKHMEEKMSEKVEGALDHLLNKIDVTIDKIKTYSGFNSAYQYLKEFKHPNAVRTASSVVLVLVKELRWLKKDLEGIKKNFGKVEISATAEALSKLCEGFYNRNFIFDIDEYVNVQNWSAPTLIETIATEAMRIDMCNAIGGAAQDIADFIAQATEEIEKVKKADEEGNR